MQNKQCYVYIIEQSETGHIKIGIAEDVEKRLRTLKTGSPLPLKIAKAIPCASRDMAQGVENFLHKRYEKQWTSGEWFRMSSSEAIADLELAVQVAHHVQTERIVVKRVVERIEVPKDRVVQRTIFDSTLSGYKSPVPAMACLTGAFFVLFLGVGLFDGPTWYFGFIAILFIVSFLCLATDLMVEHALLVNAAKPPVVPPVIKKTLSFDGWCDTHSADEV